MKKFLAFLIFSCAALANAGIEFYSSYPEYEYVEDVIYDDYCDDDYEEVEVWQEEMPAYETRCYKPQYEVVYERPAVIKETHYYNNPRTNFLSGLFGFFLGTAIGSAFSNK